MRVGISGENPLPTLESFRIERHSLTELLDGGMQGSPMYASLTSGLANWNALRHE